MITDYIQHRDVDGGWAWVVLGTTLIGQIITGALAISVGLFQSEFLTQFSGSNSYVSLISSINMSLQLTMGPVASVLCNVFGIRTAMMTGAVFLSLGLFLASFATSLQHLLGVYSVLAGLGFGITYTPLNVILGHYFHKRRSLANGLSIAACGIGVGPGSSLMMWIIEKQGWRFTLSVLAAISLQKAVIGSTYFPLKHSTPVVCGSRRPELKPEKTETSRRQSWLWFLGNSHWWILCLSYGISMVGFAIHIVHFPSYALSCGVTHGEMSNLMTAFGVVMSLSRFLGGFVCNDSSVDLLIVLFGTQGLYGLFILLMPLYAKTYGTLMVYQVMMSMFYGTSLVPVTPFIVQLFGVDKLATVFGWIMMWGGLGYLTGPVIAGMLYDVTSSYSTGFYVGGTAVIVSALLLLLIPLTNFKDVEEGSSDKLQRLLHEEQTICVEKSTEENKETNL